jgi:hypothetical protein
MGAPYNSLATRRVDDAQRRWPPLIAAFNTMQQPRVEDSILILRGAEGDAA